MNSDQIYANGRIAVLSTKLFGSDKFLRLAECATVAEALKVLSESGYGNGLTVQNSNDYEQILAAELDNALSLLRELCYDKNAVEYFLCRYNYHNAKVLMKRKYMRQSGVENCFLQTGVSPEQLQQCFVNDDYSLCTPNMAEACDEVDGEFANGNRSSQTVDILLDKAMFCDMRKYAQKSSLSLVRKLFDWEVDSTNIMLISRLKRAALGKDALDKWLIDGGSLKRRQLETVWEKGILEDAEDDCKALCAMCTQENADLVAAEQYKTSVRNKLVREYADFLTIQPVVQYFFQKVDEIDKIRMILISVKNGADKEKLKEKIK